MLAESLIKIPIKILNYSADARLFLSRAIKDLMERDFKVRILMPMMEKSVIVPAPRETIGFDLEIGRAHV